jgi:large subunit ribosomal protein L17
MRHKVAHRKLNKPTDQRMALLKNQVQALFMHERVVTTEARAREVRSLAEKLITKAKVDTVANRRYVERYIQKPPRANESKEKFALRRQNNPTAIRSALHLRHFGKAVPAHFRARASRAGRDRGAPFRPPGTPPG